MAIRGEPAGGRDQSRHNLVSGRSEDPNHDAVMRIGSEAPKRRTHSSNRHESQGALPGFRHLDRRERGWRTAGLDQIDRLAQSRLTSDDLQKSSRVSS